MSQVIRLLLWAVVLVGVCALCDDTREATWLALPALLALLCLLPRGGARARLEVCHGR